ncbi:hypothetical protein [Haloferula rosea]|uniref:Uncharacterized protein n=1 Tax=Haloferula rosea TaxID=490093 RepID=A0A934RCH1_9BACT|nr:hypothetical protein [Haloferula rosea]MBK1828143.1 hypothetical protein [Haloferula rosea]
MNDQDQPQGDDSDWNEEPEDDDWGDAPDEDPESVPTKRFWSLGMIVLWIVMILLAIGVSLPLFLRRSCGDGMSRTMAISNARQVGLALLEFDQEFGKFPDESTVDAVLRGTGTDLDLAGQSSNALFRQLIAYGIQSEDIFHCKHPRAVRPDNIITPGEALKPGEVGFSYVAGLDSSQAAGLPLIAAPMKEGTTSFHEDGFAGKVVVLRLDLSASALELGDADGGVVTEDGKALFDPESGLWPEGYELDLRHPEFPRARAGAPGE